MAGARAVVYLSEAVAEGFARRLGDAGAEVRRAGADYEASLAHAAAEAERHGWTPVSDCSSPGPPETALEVMRGYTILLEEAAEALEAVGGPASHVFIQAGVGGLAAAAAGYLRDRWGEDFRLIVVQPAGSPCLLESIRAGRVLTISRRGTALGRLDCAAPSPLAFDMLLRLADAVTTISDAEAMAAADRLGAEGAPVSACGAAGAAGLFSLCGDADGRHALNLSADARVLLVGTEAA
jgi:diaminopropionate ammonia-lyase